VSSVEIVNYTVHAGRLGTLGAEQLVVLTHRRSGPEGEALTGVSEVTFSDRFGAGGFGVVATDDGVQAYLPASQYAVWLDLLRHEDPIFLHWTTDRPGEHDPDGVLHLSTGPEWPGEGPVDLTP
jgi:hypothetical protein